MTSYHIAAAQKKETARKGKVYFVAKHFFIPVGEKDNLLISSKPGGEGDTKVDDSILVMIVDNNDPTSIVTYNHNYSKPGGGAASAHPPVNLNEENNAFNRFRGKNIRCIVKFADLCGGEAHTTDIYLTVGAGK